MIEGQKLCPLLSGREWFPCEGEKCEWWVAKRYFFRGEYHYDKGECAVIKLAEKK